MPRFIRPGRRRFGVMEPNITPWRRSVCGDRTSLFDFGVTDRQWQAERPNTMHNPAQTDAACHLALPQVPHQQHPRVQETGQCPARPLPCRHTRKNRLHVNTGMVGYAGYAPVRLDVPPPGSMTHDEKLGTSDHWYGLRLACDGHPHFLARLAGHMETGRPGRSDPRPGGAPSITHLSKGHEA